MIVVWRVTTRCNLGCGFCAYARNLRIPRVDVNENAVLRFARVLAEYSTRRGEPAMISWLGGEPLLWKPIERLSAVLSEDLGLRVSATTNGTTLKSEATLRLIAHHFAEITLSVDGPSSFHDEIRGWPGGFDALRTAVARLRELTANRQQRLLVRVNAVLMASNVQLFASLCDELVDWDIDQITFNQLGGNDRPEFHRQHRLSTEDVEMLAESLPVLRMKLQRHGVQLTGGAQYLKRLEHTAAGRSLPVLDCQPGRQFLFIDEHGRIAPCSFTTGDYGVHIDDVRSAVELGRLADRFVRSREQQRSRWCGDCPSTQVFTKFVA